MIDIHSHILPAIDDGSQSVEESLELMGISRKQGVELMVATPHFYAEKDRPEMFFERRSRAEDKLRDAMFSDYLYPKLMVGAEVAYFDSLVRSDILEKLCIRGTNVLLLEMPFRQWSKKVISDVIDIQKLTGLQVLIAHINRYIQFQERGVLESFLEQGIWIQSNADAFINKHTVRQALGMLEKNQIHVLGSDCHNLEARRPNMIDAVQIITDKFGEGKQTQITTQTAQLLGLWRDKR